MARRGYRVTVYEKEDKAGGMLQHGIPQFRLPEDVLEAEIRRVLDVGVELELGTTVGRDIAIGELRARHAALFLGIGAGRSLRLNIAGEEGPGVWTGTQCLAALNHGDPPALGDRVVVVGGGNTAIDAARCARRAGARVTLMYRRSAAEMPAIRSEVEGALEEGVEILYLAAPLRIERADGGVRAVVAQRMQLGEPDASGRRRCVPVEDSEFEVLADSVITAVSQEPDWSQFAELDLDGAPGRAKDGGLLGEALWAGGDVLGAGIAGLAIANGRKAAEAVHAHLRGLPPPAPVAAAAVISAATGKADYYAPKERAALPSLAVDARLAQPEAEVDQTLGEAAFLEEVMRCFSCGQCFGCEHCFTYCNAGGFTRLEEPQRGAYFALSLDSCEACRKCIEVCPCGFLSAIPHRAAGASA
jgi:formate dehydrogenase major subunit